MRRTICLLVCLSTPLLGGCASATQDILFGLLRSHYTAESDDDRSRYSHFKSQVDAWEHYDRFGS